MRKNDVALVGLVTIAVAISIALFFMKQQRDKRQEQLASYYGVKLSASKSEVGYLLGYPASVQGPLRPDPEHRDWQLSDELKLNKNGDLEGEPSSLPGGSALKKYDEWHYYFPPDRVTVEFDSTSKAAKSIHCQKWTDEGVSKCRPILGIGVGTSESEVRQTLGDPAHHEITGIYKSMKYPSLGLELMLTEGRVYLIRKTLPIEA